MKKCMIGERYGSLVVIEKVKIPGKPKPIGGVSVTAGIHAP